LNVGRAPQLKALGVFDFLGNMNIVSWSRKVAALALDRLIDEGLLKRKDFEAALTLRQRKSKSV